MNGASLGERIWYGTAVPIFLERYLLPMVAALTVLVVVTNPMSLDLNQRITGGAVVVLVAYFVSHTAYKMNQPAKSPPKDETLKYPGFTEKLGSVSLSIGGFSVGLPLDKLRDPNFKGAAFNIGGEIINPYLDGNHLYVDVNLYAGPDTQSVQVRRGAITVNIPGWDTNSDERAFEIVNQDGIPVFQLVY